MKKIKKITDLISGAMLIVFILFAALLVGVRIFGIQPYIVLSGSMEPEIYTGSLVYVNHITQEEAANLQVGDTVTYVVDKKGTLVTHKIYEVVGTAYVRNQYGELVLDENGNPTVAIDDNGNPIIMYTTYGINNKNPDLPTGYTLDGTLGVGNLASSNVVGKPMFVIPYLGYVSHFVQNPPGKYIALIICAFLIINAFWSSSSDKKKTETDGDAAASNNREESQPKSE